jgi:hypothetical protein
MSTVRHRIILHFLRVTAFSQLVHRGGEGTALRAEVGIPSVTSHQGQPRRDSAIPVAKLFQAAFQVESRDRHIHPRWGP